MTPLSSLPARLLLAALVAGLSPTAAADATPPRLVDLAPAIDGGAAEDRTITRIGSYGTARAMQLQLKAGSVMPAHAAPERVLVIVLGGRGHFDFGDERVALQARQVLHMAPGESHGVTAETDLDLLLVRIEDGAPAP